jgi:4-hydroxybenzoate polyprenyltransferase
MIQRSTWLHLRIPFSIFLLPVYLFAVSISTDVNLLSAIFVFVILHFFLYPASNGFNSYFDKDEESIGGLKHPPKVTRELYYVSLIFDFIAIACGFFLSWQFALMLFIYGLVSKAYSHPSLRLKKYAVTGWFIAGLFQGFFTFIMVLVGIQNIPLMDIINQEKVLMAGFLSTLLLWGSYPMTQVYQHEEDGKRGDKTISLKLGILGTFHFTALVFLIADILFLFFYFNYYGIEYALLFQLFVLPMLAYFIAWYIKVRKEKNQANFENTMRLNLISSVCLNLFFILVFYQA